jgi:hypothetical protein
MLLMTEPNFDTDRLIPKANASSLPAVMQQYWF